MTEAAYDETHDETYKPKLRKLLEDVRREALKRGLECGEPGDLSDEDVRVYVLVRPAGGADEDGVDVSISIPESEHYDGMEGGLNFALAIVGYEGTIVGGFTPFNFTQACWVERADPVAVEERWEVFIHQFDASAVIDECQGHFGRE